MPAAPAFFILSALSLANSHLDGKKRNLWISLILLLNLSLVTALLWGLGQYPDLWRSVWLMTATIAVCTMLCVFLTVVRKPLASLVIYPLSVFAGIYVFLYDVLPQRNWWESRELAAAVNSSLTNNHKLLLYNIYDFGMVFYTNGRVELTPEGYFPKIENAPSLYNYVRQKKEAFVVVGNEELSWIDPILCPACNSSHLTKQYSRFGMGASSSNGGYESLPVYKGSGCGCTPSSCGCKN